MPRRWYENVSGGQDLNLFIDPLNYNETTDNDRLAIITEMQGLSDEIRSVFAHAQGASSLDNFDSQLQDEEWEIRDRLDYYSLYSNRTQEITVRDGAWFTPDSVNSFCGEDVGNEVGLSIDGANNTQWKHTANERHSVIYQLRAYPKKISKVRFRYNGSAAIEQLTNLDVHAANNVANIDDAGNILETGINPTWPAGPAVWVEHTLAQKKAKARYIKLLFDTAHASNTMQVREFAVWVETRDP